MQSTESSPFQSCLQAQAQILKEFSSCSTAEDRYKKIIDLGKTLGELSPEYHTDTYRVKGCQSVIYLRSYKKDDKIYFEASSEALISAGLAVLLIRAYSGQTPQTVLKCPPKFLEDLSLHTSLSPSRSNGLASLHLRIKQDALKALM